MCSSRELCHLIMLPYIRPQVGRYLFRTINIHMPFIIHILLRNEIDPLLDPLIKLHHTDTIFLCDLLRVVKHPVLILNPCIRCVRVVIAVREIYE